MAQSGRFVYTLPGCLMHRSGIWLCSAVACFEQQKSGCQLSHGPESFVLEGGRLLAFLSIAAMPFLLIIAGVLGLKMRVFLLTLGQCFFRACC